MPQGRSGSDPSHRRTPAESERPGDDSAVAADVPEPAHRPAKPATRNVRALSDEQLLERSWRAEAGHVGNWQKGDRIPSGVIVDAAWLRHLLERGHISVLEDER